MADRKEHVMEEAMVRYVGALFNLIIYINYGDGRVIYMDTMVGYIIAIVNLYISRFGPKDVSKANLFRFLSTPFIVHTSSPLIFSAHHDLQNKDQAFVRSQARYIQHHL